MGWVEKTRHLDTLFRILKKRCADRPGIRLLPNEKATFCDISASSFSNISMHVHSHASVSLTKRPIQ